MSAAQDGLAQVAQPEVAAAPDLPRAIIVHFLRHGEVHNPDAVLYGRQHGFHLSTTGFQEAREAGPRLAEVCRELASSIPGLASLPSGIGGGAAAAVSALKHSPLLRTRETAEVLAASHPDHAKLADLLEPDADLLECNTPYELRPLSEIQAWGWNMYSHGREDEGFETFPQVAQRVQTFVGKLRRSPRHAGTQVVVVTHGDLCLSARLWGRIGAKGLVAMAATLGPAKPSVAQLDQWGAPYPGHCSLTTLVFEEGEVDRPRWHNAAREGVTADPITLEEGKL